MKINSNRFYIYSVFLSAFLLFQIQPMIARIILPLFGGSSAVWSTCLLCFQAGLLIGYSYSHLIVKRLSPKNQVITHLSLLCISLICIPVFPSKAVMSNLSGNPTLDIIFILTATVGFPYIMVSATGPLLQHWFSLSNPKTSPYRLYALSNLGSLIGLLSYPAIIEPYLKLNSQSWFWSAGYILFILCCGVVGKSIWVIKAVVANGAKKIVPPVKGIQKLLWLLLAFMGTTSLLSVTNKLTQDIIVVPFLWIIPLSLYLLSFIIAFEKPSLYNRKIVIPLILIFISVIVYFQLRSDIYLTEIPLKGAIISYNLFIFLLCLALHGELARLKPHENYITLYYLIISAGGILGGVFINLLVPFIFKNYWEIYFTFIAGILLLSMIILNNEKIRKNNKQRYSFISAVAIVEAVLIYFFMQDYTKFNDEVIACERNFYGVLKVTEQSKGTPDAIRTMSNGGTIHGMEFMAAGKDSVPLTYYTNQSGIGLALTLNSSRVDSASKSRKIGMIGLGIGTISSFERENDTIKYYEINPLVDRFASENFKFLHNAKGKTILIDGDGRKSLERELESQGSNQFDVLAIDAFTGDVIPTHLLTLEAVDLYMKHLKTGGILAFHISCTYLDLMPVMCGINESKKIPLCYIEENNENNPFRSVWVLFTNNHSFLNDPQVLELSQYFNPNGYPRVYWTDDYSSVLPLFY